MGKIITWLCGVTKGCGDWTFNYFACLFVLARPRVTTHPSLLGLAQKVLPCLMEPLSSEQTKRAGHTNHTHNQDTWCCQSQDYFKKALQGECFYKLPEQTRIPLSPVIHFQTQNFC